VSHWYCRPPGTGGIQCHRPCIPPLRVVYEVDLHHCVDLQPNTHIPIIIPIHHRPHVLSCNSPGGYSGILSHPTVVGWLYHRYTRCTGGRIPTHPHTHTGDLVQIYHLQWEICTRAIPLPPYHRDNTHSRGWLYHIIILLANGQQVYRAAARVLPGIPGRWVETGRDPQGPFLA